MIFFRSSPKDKRSTKGFPAALICSCTAASNSDERVQFQRILKISFAILLQYRNINIEKSVKLEGAG